MSYCCPKCKASNYKDPCVACGHSLHNPAASQTDWKAEHGELLSHISMIYMDWRSRKTSVGEVMYLLDAINNVIARHARPPENFCALGEACNPACNAGYCENYAKHTQQTDGGKESGE